MNEAAGEIDAPVLVVMLSPPSKRMNSYFWKHMQKAGIQKSDTRIVYMLDEPPAGSAGKPLKSQLRAAKERFEREVLESTPKVAVPMGREAFVALTGINESIFDARGYVIDESLFHSVEYDVYTQVGEYKGKSKSGAVKGDPKMKWVRQAGDPLMKGKGAPVIATFTLDHVRTASFAVAPALKEDLTRAARAANGTLKLLDDGLWWYSDWTNKQSNGKKSKYTLDDLLKKDMWGEVIALDIETHGVDNDVIDRVSLSDGTYTCSVEWSERARKYMEDIFKLKNRYFAVHNSPFDLPRLRASGVKISKEVIERQIFDTMFGGVVLQPDLHKSLGRMASLYLDIRPWKSGSKNMDSPWRMAARLVPVEYSAKDSFYTAWIAIVQIVIMKRIGTWNLFMGQGGHPGPGEMATIPVLQKMSADGMPINKKYVAIWAPRLENQVLRLQKLWSRHFPKVSPTSNPKLQKLFYGQWELPIYRTREDGISTDELALISLSAFVEAQRELPTHKGAWKEDPRCNHRTFDLLLRIREKSKLLGTYVTPVLLEDKARVHPSYLPVSKDSEKGEDKNSEMNSKGNTATGRLAAYNPNIANQPKEARILYVPDEEDHCFIEADYKMAELHIMAYRAGDKKLIRDLKSKIKLHQINADRIGVSYRTAKNVTFASQYLATPGKQSEMILKQDHTYLSPAECYRVSEAIWAHYTDVTAFRNHLINLCDTKRFLVNAFGRPRGFHDGRSAAAVNFIPQSEVADILWCVLKPVAEAAERHGGRIYTTVYDSILIAVPKDNVAAAAAEVRDIMQQKFDNIAKGFFIPVELKVAPAGEPWSAVEDYELKEVA